jgi:hypothetical protein
VPVAWTSEDLEAVPPDAAALAVKLAVLEEKDLRILSGLKSLETLQVTSPCTLGDDGLRVVATLPRLKMLVASLGKVTPEGLAMLGDCRTLRSLDVGARGTSMNDALLGAIGRLTSLEELEISGCSFAGDAGVAALAGLTRLKSLDLSWSDLISGKTLDALSPTVEKLSFTGVRISKEGAAAMARLPGLRRLKFYNGGIGDDHLRELAACRKLQDLWIHRDNRDPVIATDVGVDALRALVGLRRFRITGTAATRPAVQRLAGSLPGIFFVR